MTGNAVSHAWRALKHRNFKLFFFGQSTSLIGTSMTRLATTWLVYRLTHSALLLGVVSFAGQIVSFALGLFTGAVCLAGSLWFTLELPALRAFNLSNSLAGTEAQSARLL